MTFPVLSRPHGPSDIGVAMVSIVLWVVDKMPTVAATLAAAYTAYRIYDLWDTRRRSR